MVIKCNLKYFNILEFNEVFLVACFRIVFCKGSVGLFNRRYNVSLQDKAIFPWLLDQPEKLRYTDFHFSSQSKRSTLKQPDNVVLLITFLKVLL